MNITERAAKVLQQIDAALAMVDKATPGPWNVENLTPARHDVVKPSGGKITSIFRANDGCHEYRGAALPDAAFIAASRTILPTSLEIIQDDIKAWLELLPLAEFVNHIPEQRLTAICDKWEAGR